MQVELTIYVIGGSTGKAGFFGREEDNDRCGTHRVSATGGGLFVSG